MDMLRHMNAALLYIEAHLDDDIEPAEIARRACVSYGSFARIFGYLTGMTLKEYIRRRRLTLAAYELQRGEVRILDAAVKYGFGSADAFARAFRAQHGVLPSRIGGASVAAYGPVSFHILTKGAEKMNVRIEQREALRVAGLTKHFGCEAAERYEDEHIMLGLETDRWMKPLCESLTGVWYGIWQDGGYTIAKEAKTVTCPDAKEHVIPAGTWAVFTSGCGGLAGEELPRLREQAFGAWLPESGWRAAGDYEVEVYHLYPRDARDKRQYELWIPIERA